MPSPNPIHPRFMSRYVRGGCWYTKFATSMNRDYCGPGSEDALQGFRTYRNHRQTTESIP